MIDIHAHILPGIDDGAETLKEAAQMCRIAAADGIQVVVATPHQRHEQWLNTDRGKLERLLKQVQSEVGASPRLVLGAEISVGSELLTELERPGKGNLIPLAGSRYLLLELDSMGIGADPLGLTHELLIEGWVPIFSHVERFRWLADDLDLMERLAKRGALFQVTALSVTGDFGGTLQACTRALLDAGLVHFVASDMHHPVWRRPPGLGRAYREIASRWGEGLAHRLTKVNPAAVIENRSLTDSPLVLAAGARLAPDL